MCRLRRLLRGHPLRDAGHLDEAGAVVRVTQLVDLGLLGEALELLGHRLRAAHDLALCPHGLGLARHVGCAAERFRESQRALLLDARELDGLAQPREMLAQQAFERLRRFEGDRELAGAAHVGLGARPVVGRLEPEPQPVAYLQRARRFVGGGTQADRAAVERHFDRHRRRAEAVALRLHLRVDRGERCVPVAAGDQSVPDPHGGDAMVVAHLALERQQCRGGRAAIGGREERANGRRPIGHGAHAVSERRGAGEALRVGEPQDV